MVRIVLLSMVVFAACSLKKVANTSEPALHTAISPSTDRLLLGGRINRLPPFQGSRERYFLLAGTPDCPQPRDERLMLLLRHTRTGDIHKYVLCTQSPEDRSWKMVAMLDAEQFPDEVTWGSAEIVVVFHDDTIKIFRLAKSPTGLRWKESR